MSDSAKYVPALGHAPLTRFYDFVVGVTCRESTFKQALLAQAAIKPGYRVLDVACGTGTLALMMKEQVPEVTVTGIDGDPVILDIARRKASGAKLDVQFDQGMSCELPYDDESFDAVTSSLFFHHLNKEVKAGTASEMFRVLKPGGEIHIADWGRPANWIMRLAFFGVRILDGFENTEDNSRGLLPEIFTASGFRNVALRITFNTMFGTMALYSAKKKLAYT